MRYILSMTVLFFTIAPFEAGAAGSEIVFLSDFGTKDDSVSQCKAAIYAVNPEARITDMTHDVPPFDTRFASFLLSDSAKIWPSGTVFLAVVDPGVGTSRKAMALETNSGHIFVGPDNGLFTFPAKKLGIKKAVSLENRKYFRDLVTTTFHGRDIYAHVAGWLSKDNSTLEKMGPNLTAPVLSDWTEPRMDSSSISGSFLYIEKTYGNTATDIPGDMIEKAGLYYGATVHAVINGKEHSFPFLKTFGNVAKGRPLAYINSRGLFSLAMNMGDFSSAYGVEAGSPVKIILPENELADVAGMAAGNIFLDIRYATASNFTGKKIYPVSRCLLRRKAADALMEAAEKASKSPKPFSLCVLDCYRPLSVQKIFWSIMPDERYVADPAKGSKHNRGMAVDVTACGKDAQELEMPSAYDDFSEKAHRDYKGASREALSNSAVLEKTMAKAGFLPLSTEWWHFDFPGWENMEIMDEPLNGD